MLLIRWIALRASSLERSCYNRVALIALLTLTPLAAANTVAVGPEGELDKKPLMTREMARALCAIGDLHGDEAQAMRALHLCEAVDENGAWVGGQMTVVQ